MKIEYLCWLIPVTALIINEAANRIKTGGKNPLYYDIPYVIRKRLSVRFYAVVAIAALQLLMWKGYVEFANQVVASALYVIGWGVAVRVGYHGARDIILYQGFGGFAALKRLFWNPKPRQ
jgi:hypothetical protein